MQLNSHQRQSNNGYSIPTQIPAPSAASSNAYSTVKNSQQKFQSIKASTAVKATQQIIPQSSIEVQAMPSKQSNYAQLLSSTMTSQASKKTKGGE